jgi:hypothetical protein
MRTLVRIAWLPNGSPRGLSNIYYSSQYTEATYPFRTRLITKALLDTQNSNVAYLVYVPR